MSPEALVEYKKKRNARALQWRHEHREEVRRQSRARQEAKREYARRYREENRERHRELGKLRYAKERNDPDLNLRLKLDSARARAKRRGVPFDLQIEDIVIPAVCPVLGIPLIWKRRTERGERDYAPTLDRIRNDEGYVKGNIRMISARANRWKNEMTLEDAKRIVAYMELHEILS